MVIYVTRIPMLKIDQTRHDDKNAKYVDTIFQCFIFVERYMVLD